MQRSGAQFHLRPRDRCHWEQAARVEVPVYWYNRENEREKSLLASLVKVAARHLNLQFRLDLVSGQLTNGEMNSHPLRHA